RRHAHAHAPGRVPRRGHLGSPAAGCDGAVLAMALRSGAARSDGRTIRGAGKGRSMAATRVTDDFELTYELEAHEPPEARGLRRDEVRLMVSHPATGSIEHARFADLPRWLSAGDLLVVNTSATVNAALSARTADGRCFELHLSTHL